MPKDNSENADMARNHTPSVTVHLAVAARDVVALRALLYRAIEEAPTSRIVASYVRVLRGLREPTIDETVRANLAHVLETAEIKIDVHADDDAVRQLMAAARDNSAITWPPLALSALRVPALHQACVSALVDVGAGVVSRLTRRAFQRHTERLLRRLDHYHPGWRQEATQ